MQKIRTLRFERLQRFRFFEKGTISSGVMVCLFARHILGIVMVINKMMIRKRLTRAEAVMARYETPEYEVMLKEDKFELRKYKDFYIVEYENPGDPDLNYGFGTLFRYISRSNDQNEKINMTIPVIKEVTGKGLKMAFVVPQSYWNKVPIPTDERLKIAKFEEGEFATLTYSGSWSSEKEDKQIRLLEAWAREKHLTIVSNFMVAAYNGPYVPPMLRRNEVMVRVSNHITR